MRRETSEAAYREISANGLLSKMRMEVYELIYRHGPITQRELTNMLPPIQESSARPRFAELEKMGVIESGKTRTCRVTGRNAIEWDVTGLVPTKTNRPDRIKCPHCRGKGYLEQGKLL